MRGMLSLDNTPTRQRSLLAALEVVRTDGLPELTTRAIARRSGLTQPAIYRHFHNKEELVGEVLGAIRSAFHDRLEAADGEGDSLARLLRALETFRDFAIEEPRLYDALFLQPGSVPTAAGPGRRGSIFGFLVERVTECGREGVLRSSGPVMTALSLLAHAQGLILLYRHGRFGSGDRFAAAYRRSMQDLLRGMAAS
jgi:AcrR family transcriptional regulator